MLNYDQIWRLDNVTRPSEQNVHDTGPSTGPTNPSYIATLRRHLKAVNAVQFHPTGIQAQIEFLKMLCLKGIHRPNHSIRRRW